jgi:hypothetical protein
MAGKPKFTASNWEGWRTTQEVFARAEKTFGSQECWAAVIDRIRAGHIRTAARVHSRAIRGLSAEPGHDPMMIPHDYWRDWVEDTPRLHAGDALFRIPPSHYGGNIRIDPTIEVICFGIRLDPEQVNLHFPEPPTIQPTPTHVTVERFPGGNTWVSEQYDTGPAVTALKHAGGRPPKTWWDEVWLHVAIRLAKGWKPAKQAEIEAEMKSVAENYDPQVADSTIRIRASKLAKALGMKAEN